MNVFVTENGVPQPVTFFSCPGDTTNRLSIALLLDRSSSMINAANGTLDPDSGTLRAAKSAISSFLRELLPADEAALLSFTTSMVQRDHIFRVEQDFTRDTDLLRAALVPISAGGGTRLWQALLDAAAVLEPRRGRRFIVVVTDGRNTLGQVFRQPAYDRLLAANIPVYAIGLGPDPDRAELQTLTGTTGGKIYFAPDSLALSSAFSALADEVLHDDCILRYTSSEGCRDGSWRNIELHVAGPGGFGEADTSYTVDTRLTPLSVYVADGRSVESGQAVDISVNVEEYLSMSQNVQYDMALHYDTGLLQFISASTAGQVSAWAVIDAEDSPPGSLRIHADPHYPRIPTGSLFTLHFLTNKSPADTSTTVQLSQARLSQQCPVDLSTCDGEVIITGCERIYRLGMPGVFIRSGAGVVDIPLRVAPPFEIGDRVDLTVQLEEQNGILEYIGLDSASMPLDDAAVEELAIGRSLRLHITGYAAREDSTVLKLRYSATEQEETRRTAIRVLSAGLVSACRTELYPEDASVTVEGYCRPLVRRRSGTAKVDVHPNPFMEQAGVSVHHLSDGLLSVMIFDDEGRRVATVIREDAAAGVYRFSIDASSWAVGGYTIAVRSGNQIASRRLLHIR